MRILNLYSENIKKIRVVDITPEGDTVVISGKNGQGKSSVIDSIAMVLGGKKLIPSKPIREGEETAKITVDIGDYKVTRNWTNPKTSYLKLENKDGAKITNGQLILNKLIGDLSFDPLEFTTMDPAKRFEILRKLTKIDFTEHDKIFSKIYEERTEVAREGKSLNGRLETEFKDLPNLADKVDDIEVIKEQRSLADSENSKIDLAQKDLLGIAEKIEDGEKKITENTALISSYREQIKNAQDEIKLLRRASEILKKAKVTAAETANAEYTNLSSFDDKIEKFYEYKKAKEDQDRKAQVEQERDAARKQWDELDARLKDMDKLKSDTVAKAKMPIDGLNFGDKEVLFNGIPFAQLSTSEQIQVSMSIAIAMNPRLRVAMIYNGSLLDDDAMESIAKIAADKDIQIWIERISNKPDGNSIFIENGEVLQ